MTDIVWPELRCQCFDLEHQCVCPPMERACRAWKKGFQADHSFLPKLPEMSADQRAFLVADIATIEGWSDYQDTGQPSAEIASDALSAWSDYARDKGLMP